jgi:hypothetical protein
MRRCHPFMHGATRTAAASSADRIDPSPACHPSVAAALALHIISEYALLNLEILPIVRLTLQCHHTSNLERLHIAQHARSPHTRLMCELLLHRVLGQIASAGEHATSQRSLLFRRSRFCISGRANIFSTFRLREDPFLHRLFCVAQRDALPRGQLLHFSEVAGRCDNRFRRCVTLETCACTHRIYVRKACRCG